MKTSIRRRKIFLLLSVTVVTIAIIGGIVAWGHQTHATAEGCMPGSGVTHQVTIKNGQVSPEFTDGVRCDKIIFTNLDAVTREIAFGPHEQHVPYDGISEKFINKGQSFTLTLDQVGMFHFHDHLHDKVMGYFNVYK